MSHTCTYMSNARNLFAAHLARVDASASSSSAAAAAAADLLPLAPPPLVRQVACAGEQSLLARIQALEGRVTLLETIVEENTISDDDEELSDSASDHDPADDVDPTEFDDAEFDD